MEPPETAPPSAASHPDARPARRRRSLPRRTVLRSIAGATTAGIAGATGVAGADDRDGRSGGTRSAPAASVDPAATLGVDGLSEVVVDESGETVYGALRSGYVTVDVSDPSDPRVLAERRGLLDDYDEGPMERIYDVKVSGDRLLVAGPNGGPGLSGFVLVDVSDPATPERVAVHLTSHAIHNAYLDGDTAYLTDSSPGAGSVVVVDVSDDEPSEIGRWHPRDAGYDGDSCHDLYAQDGVLYAAYWDAGTWLLDASDPADPSPIARVHNTTADDAENAGFGLPGNSHYVQPNADATLLAVGREAWDDPDSDGRQGPGPVDVFDVADPTDPERLTTLAPPEDPESEGGHTAHNLGWQGTRLYTSWYRGGVRAYDLADPREPTLLASFRDETATFWTAKPIAGGFVGSSYQDPTVEDRQDRFEGVGAALHVFESPDGGGDPAPTTDPVGVYRYDEGRASGAPAPEATTTRATTDAAPATTPDSRTDAGSPTADAPETATPTAGTAAPEDPTTDESTATDDGETPGFGALAALLGGGLAAGRLWRRRNGD